MQTHELLNNCYTKVPNVVFDHMRILSPVQFMIFLVIFRKTIGWRKVADKMAVSQIMAISGLTRPTVRTAIKQLIAIGAISRIKGNGKVPAILRIEMKWLEALVKEKPLPSQGKEFSHTEGKNAFPTKDIPDLKETSSSQRKPIPVSLQDFKQALMQDGWLEEEVDEAFRRFKEQREGTVKYPRKWIPSVLQSIRDNRQAAIEREREQSEKKHEEDLLAEEQKRQQKEEAVQKAKRAQENKTLVQPFYGRPWIKEAGQNCIKLYVNEESLGVIMGFDDPSFREMLLECMEKEASAEELAGARQLLESMKKQSD